MRLLELINLFQKNNPIISSNEISWLNQITASGQVPHVHAVITSFINFAENNPNEWKK